MSRFKAIEYNNTYITHEFRCLSCGRLVEMEHLKEYFMGETVTKDGVVRSRPFEYCQRCQIDGSAVDHHDPTAKQVQYNARELIKALERSAISQGRSRREQIAKFVDANPNDARARWMKAQMGMRKL